MNHLMTYLPSLSPDLVITHPGELRTVIDWNHWREHRAALLDSDSNLPHYLLLPEIHEVLNAIKEMDTHLLVNTLWHTGTKISETLSLTKESFHIDGIRNSKLVLAATKQRKRGRPTSKDKAKPDRSVPIIDPVYLDEIERYLATRKPKKDELLFQMSRQAIDNRLKKIMADLDLPIDSLSTQTFRHSFAIHSLFLGRSVKTVQEWLGHRNVAEMEIYTRILSNDPHHLMYGMIF